MIIRDMAAPDAAKIKAIYDAHGAPYPWPDLNDQTFMAVRVAEADGEIVGAFAARRTAEVFLFLRREWGTPGFRYDALQRMQRDGLGILRGHHVNDCHALIPPTVCRSFGRRLEALGWWRPDWPLWARKVS